MNFHAWQWCLAALGALLVGVSKTGITGLSLIFVSVFAAIMPARRSTGLVLPLLMLGDVVAVLSYRRHAQWRHVWRLLPWAGAGVVIGYLALGRMDERQTRFAIGAIVLGLAILYIVRRLRRGGDREEHAPWFAPAIGILAGFTTLVANAAGPLTVIYMLAMRLPKMEYMGTTAVFFLLLNFFKMPFMIGLGLITRESLVVSLALAPAVLAGTWLGKWLLRWINQRTFENIVLALAVVAGASDVYLTAPSWLR
ncbi:MAG TPA: sulfite exporter TauE/SafE family protein [Opitutaceae bacterium]|nr:sulfite exporter TauE/SafE family protein [Opitutaceae bacterium]